jgi:YidC/Oxa1 family membrane protein insertase
MQKRLLIAFALSFIILVAGQKLMTKPQPRAVPVPEQAVVTPQVPSLPEAPAEQGSLTEYQLDTALFLAVFVDQNAELKEAGFKKFKNYVFALNNGFSTGKELDFSRQTVDGQKVTYSHSDAKKRITKTIEFSGYEGKLTLVVENIDQQPLKFAFPLAVGTINLQPANRMAYHDVSVSLPDKVAYPNMRKDSSFSSVNFLSLRDNYFCAIVEPVTKNYSASLKKEGNNLLVGLQSPEFDIAPGQKITQDFRIYLGPQDLKLLAQANPDWQSVVYFGKLDAIAQLLLKSLAFLHSVFKNWGVAIILLSLIIYVILFPLTMQQLRSMREMQRVQPKVEELRCKYKDDAMRLQKETMALYKEHKINPLGGCLPMLLQIPVFVSFYLVLARSIELKGASFLWIRDLAEPDKLYVFQQSIPFLGNELNLLPILMMGASFFQQKMSSGQMSGQSQEQQRLMMFLFPLMFGIFFYHMPAGLVLYWFSNTIFTLGQQSLIMRSK